MTYQRSRSGPDSSSEGRERVGAVPASGRRGDGNHVQQLCQGPGVRWESGKAGVAFMSSDFSKTTKTSAQKKRWENIHCQIYLGLMVGIGLLVNCGAGHDSPTEM